MHGNVQRTRKRIEHALHGFTRRLARWRKRAEQLYEKSPLKGGKLAAVVLALLAVLWIGSGIIFPHHPAAEQNVAVQNNKKFRVGFLETQLKRHQPRLALSGRTEADKKVAIVARTQAIITELRVKRGDRVKQGDIIAVLTDDGRNAQLQQARALVQQRKAEYEARMQLIEKGNLPKLDANTIAAQLRAAEAALAQAEAEIERIRITAPWDGVVDQVSAEQGQFLMLMPNMGQGAGGNEIARMISLDPLLIIVEVSERKLSGVQLGETAEIRLVSGERVKGRVRYIAKSASQTTRTYRVDVEIPNPDNKIPDGITAEVLINLAPVDATKVPRSALVFSTTGRLGVRVVEQDGKVVFIPVEIADDEQQSMWVTGIPDKARLIVQGQDFVREDQIVEAVPAEQQSAQR